MSAMAHCVWGKIWFKEVISKIQTGLVGTYDNPVKNN